MDFSEFLGSLVLSKVEGLLLCIKTKKLERRVRYLKKILYNDFVLEISGFYNC